jgi:hypothetical protein
VGLEFAFATCVVIQGNQCDMQRKLRVLLPFFWLMHFAVWAWQRAACSVQRDDREWLVLLKTLPANFFVDGDSTFCQPP